MNREQTQALVDLWDDLDIALKFVDIDINQVDMIVREEGDDIETLTGECGWIEVCLMMQGSGPLLVMDPRGSVWREKEDPEGNMHVVQCKPSTRNRRDGTTAITSEDIA